jgi:hypothetical protein
MLRIAGSSPCPQSSLKSQYLKHILCANMAMENKLFPINPICDTISEKDREVLLWQRQR